MKYFIHITKLISWILFFGVFLSPIKAQTIVQRIITTVVSEFSGRLQEYASKNPINTHKRLLMSPVSI